MALYNDAYVDVLRFVQRRAGRTGPRTSSTKHSWLPSQSRQGALEVRIAEVTKESTESEDDLVAFHVDLASAWQQLSPDDQEVLSLAMREALPSPQAGRVLGITAAAYRIRLYRARRSLRRALKHTTSTAFDAEYSVTEQLA
ncbi:MAG: hypothetical protein QOH19_1165 [Actinomycetota bacterium]|nr:hypothetical protein [Actinomycetota bacterium]